MAGKPACRWGCGLIRTSKPKGRPCARDGLIIRVEADGVNEGIIAEPTANYNRPVRQLPHGSYVKEKHHDDTTGLPSRI